jgi:hypothetical protein
LLALAANVPGAIVPADVALALLVAVAKMSKGIEFEAAGKY